MVSKFKALWDEYLERRDAGDSEIEDIIYRMNDMFVHGTWQEEENDNIIRGYN